MTKIIIIKHGFLLFGKPFAKELSMTVSCNRGREYVVHMSQLGKQGSLFKDAELDGSQYSESYCECKFLVLDKSYCLLRDCTI